MNKCCNENLFSVLFFLLGVDLHPELVFSMFQKSKPVAHIGLYQYVYLLWFWHFDIMVTPGTFQMGSGSENFQLFFCGPWPQNQGQKCRWQGSCKKLFFWFAACKLVAKLGDFETQKFKTIGFHMSPTLEIFLGFGWGLVAFATLTEGFLWPMSVLTCWYGVAGGQWQWSTNVW